ncbi:hypothetical protein [Colwellia hornerae]|uniref:Uncharacterized protein n=1 Tax=Colwellia hornerae TaxID=89402 RepID=A0A5C6QNN5_9GAMM|nr:hypothetical protein [Colwellia hornerae]TWX54608.1 hypothetical protein ESZ28_07770 [Colwellia hornerae]TWX61048.1 hypothetical protein ESZ26_06545 [Colwellia hornerae]TWX70301.1 hypothetical protein ESZ27_04035 [Colwellia hornerae]
MSGCTVCRGAMDGKERRMSECTVCRGAMDGKERRMSGCTVMTAIRHQCLRCISASCTSF